MYIYIYVYIQVHLSGYFDHSTDTKPEQTDDGSITWAELQQLLANARGGSGDDNGDDAIEEMARQIEAHEKEGSKDAKRQRPSPDAESNIASKKSKKSKTQAEEQGKRLEDSNKQAALHKIRLAAAANEAAFTNPVSKHAKAHTRKLAGGTQVAELLKGSGALIKVGSKVTLTVQEEGKKGTGSKVEFVAGLKSVPSGLDRAVIGMRTGGKALVSIEAGANDKALPLCRTGVALQLEVCVDKVS